MTHSDTICSADRCPVGACSGLTTLSRRCVRRGKPTRPRVGFAAVRFGLRVCRPRLTLCRLTLARKGRDGMPGNSGVRRKNLHFAIANFYNICYNTSLDYADLQGGVFRACTKGSYNDTYIYCKSSQKGA